MKAVVFAYSNVGDRCLRVLQARGEKGLREEMLLSMAKQVDRPQLDVAVSRAENLLLFGGRRVGNENELCAGACAISQHQIDKLLSLAREHGRQQPVGK